MKITKLLIESEGCQHICWRAVHGDSSSRRVQAANFEIFERAYRLNRSQCRINASAIMSSTDIAARSGY